VEAPDWFDESWLNLFDRAFELSTARPDAVFCAVTAARLLGWVLPKDLEDGPLHVVGPNHGNRIRRPGVVSHQYSRIVPVDYCGLLVNAPVLVLLELTPVLTESQLLTLVECDIGSWRGEPHLDLHLVMEQARSAVKLRGRSKLLRALGRVRPGVASPPESRFRQWLVKQGLPEPDVACSVVLGGVEYHPDLSYPHLKIAIEYEGDHHRTDRGQWNADIARERVFHDAGWEYIRVTRDMDWFAIAELISAKIAERSVR
jgi:hypothetical protein